MSYSESQFHPNRINRLSPPEPLSRLEQQLNLYDQYSRLRLALSQTLLGLLPFTPPTKGVDPIGIVRNGVEYFLPPYSILQQRVKDNQSFFETKAEQGLTELKISLTAMPIPELQRRLSELMRRHYRQIPYSDFHKDGKPQLLQTRNPRQQDNLMLVQDLNEQTPVDISDEILQGETSGKLIYYPTSLDDPNNHGGYTKDQLITKLDNTDTPGYEFFLTSPDTFLPRQGEGQTIGGRKQLENNDTPINYLKSLTTAGNVGLITERFLTDFAIRLFLANQVSYDYHDHNGAWFIGNIVSGGVLIGDWGRSARDLRVYGLGPGNRYVRWGCPSAARVFPLR